MISGNMTAGGSDRRANNLRIQADAFYKSSVNNYYADSGPSESHKREPLNHLKAV